MTNEKLYEVLGDINEKYVSEARVYQKAKKPIWATDCRQTPVLHQAKLGLVLKNGKTSDIIQEKQSGYVSLHTHFAYFFRFMAANLSFTQFVT